MNAPFNWPRPQLQAEDFTLMQPWFAREVKASLPCHRVRFLALDPEKLDTGGLPESWREGLELLRKKGQPVVDNHAPRLFLPIWQDKEMIAAAVLEDGQQELYEKFPLKTIQDHSRLISRKLLDLKITSIDPLTGLLNSGIFWLSLESQLTGIKPFVLMLLELYPRIRDAGQAQAYLKRAAGFLNGLTGPDVPVYHLGSGTFAVLWDSEITNREQVIGDLILQRLRRDGMPRAHLGIARAGRTTDFSPQEMMDQAWEAVVEARGRGPFARATYRGPAERSLHPFHPLSSQLLNRYSHYWRKDNYFCLALLACTNPEEQPDLNQSVHRLIRPGMMVIEDTDTCISILIHEPEPEGLQLTKELADHLHQEDGRAFGIGLASYPCGSFKKSDIPMNARKALRHAGFLDVGTVVLFDGISLNISGDVYYNEGDLAAAVREYQAGLELNPASVNLLNSLGVSYIQMNRLKTAISCFEKALSLGGEEYMALFNLGAAWLAAGRDDRAMVSLEKALEVDNKNFDLCLQLAGLYCRQGNYRGVINLLSPGMADQGTERPEWEKAAALRLLGEAWWSLGQGQKAMECLQRASRYNPRDTRVLSLLGVVYDDERQGDEIARTLCRQAVELDETRWENWLRLGRVAARQGRDTEALTALQKSIRLHRKNPEALTLLAERYALRGKTRLAHLTREKLQKLSRRNSDYAPV